MSVGGYVCIQSGMESAAVSTILRPPAMRLAAGVR
jgi:hypothetical protein